MVDLIPWYMFQHNWKAFQNVSNTASKPCQMRSVYLKVLYSDLLKVPWRQRCFKTSSPRFRSDIRGPSFGTVFQDCCWFVKYFRICVVGYRFEWTCCGLGFHLKLHVLVVCALKASECEKGDMVNTMSLLRFGRLSTSNDYRTGQQIRYACVWPQACFYFTRQSVPEMRLNTYFTSGATQKVGFEHTKSNSITWRSSSLPSDQTLGC